jgi:hypothetical protein
MTRCYALVLHAVVLCFLVLLSIPRSAVANPAPSAFWYDDMEGDVSEWWTQDFTADAEPHFHVDTYYAYGSEGHSWWCGSFEYDSNGGYGNSWVDDLELPEIELGPTAVERVTWGAIKAAYRGESPSDEAARTGDRSARPMLTYAYRSDSEVGYDFTYVQVESTGSYVTLATYGGAAAWTDLGSAGLDLSDFGTTLNVRFRFASDGAYSDEDGAYLSDGGAFQVDNIKVYDYLTGEVFFFDDAESGGLCRPSTPGPSGDYWHLIDRLCPAYSDPHCWWCGDDADTNVLPPNLNNGLYTPVLEVYESYVCTCYFASHFAIPTVDNDYISFHCTCDGENYYVMRSMWGDFEQCDGWASFGFHGLSISHFCSTPFAYAGMLFVMHTTDNGCGPAVGGGAGWTLDDIWIVSNYWGARVNGEVPEQLKQLRAFRSGAASLFDAEPYRGR